MNDRHLPRLCYIGEVPIEASLHGSALLWRLLDTYPRERLLIVECASESIPSRRLSGVDYLGARMLGHRLLFSRFRPLLLPVLFRNIEMLIGSILKKVEAFNPGAILTVAHGAYWAIAAAVARRLAVPLHLIVHDDVPGTISEDPKCRAVVEREFGRVYRDATSRLCVSPAMREKYAREYGVSGKVLYPSRARQAVVNQAPPARLGLEQKRLTAVFAGTLSFPYVAALIDLARLLEGVGGRLLIFGPVDQAAGRRVGLIRENIEFRGLLESERFKEQCRNEADFLFVPMSFGIQDRINAEISFPSKLTDYTAIGCPLLIRGPSYCSAVRWALENPGVAETVEREDSHAFEQAVKALSSAKRRIELGREALRVGDKYFSPAAAESIFHRALQPS